MMRNPRRRLRLARYKKTDVRCISAFVSAFLNATVILK